MKHQLIEIDNDTFVLFGTPDTQAVLGAKTSRAPDITKRFEEMIELAGTDTWPADEAPMPIKEFLSKNLAGYGHASIAEMAPAWVHGRGFGWPNCWLLEDTPLFKGQEVSTRAVDMTRVGDADKVCAHTSVSEELHQAWLDVYRSAREKMTATGGYKFDEIRWLLPGTTRSGVTMTMYARDAVRHLERIAGIESPEEHQLALAAQMVRGFEVAAPETMKAIYKGVRRDWVPTLEKINYGRIARIQFRGAKAPIWRCHNTEIRSGTPATSVILLRHDDTFRAPLRMPTPRPTRQSYLDPLWKTSSRYHLSIDCTVGAARDWHRHRPVMPWILSVITSDGHPVLAPWLDTSALDQEALHKTWEMTQKEFARLWPDWDCLHALPYGTLVRLECVATLPDLLYMLELRAFVSSANAEYAAQAQSGLRQLIDLLPENVVCAEQIFAEPPE